MPLPPSPLPASTAAIKGGSGNGQQQQPTPTVETGVGGSVAGLVPHRKEVGALKVQADKKKMDARKKSLKRL